MLGMIVVVRVLGNGDTEPHKRDEARRQGAETARRLPKIDSLKHALLHDPAGLYRSGAGPAFFFRALW